MNPLDRIVVSLVTLITTYCCANSAFADHLVPVEKYMSIETGVSAEYRRVWQQQLSVSPDDPVTFVSLPGLFGEEEAVSIRRLPSNRGFRVVYRKASSRLWNYFAPGGNPPNGTPQDVPIESCEAAIPETAAKKVLALWVTMIRQAKACAPTDSFSLDSNSQIFLAVDEIGHQLRAQAPDELGHNTHALVRLALSLEDYCEAPPQSRRKIAKMIEHHAEGLLRKVDK
jgi:hypothetical protein